MNSHYREQLDFLESQYATMCQLLRQWVDINSYSQNLPGLAAFSNHLSLSFSQLGGKQSYHPLSPLTRLNANGDLIQYPLGQAIRIQKRPKAAFKVLLCGHMDTVFPLSSPFQQCIALSKEQWCGPGIIDMKGGLVVMLYALLALERSPYAKNIGWEVFINADEELGSMGSASLLEQSAKQNNIGLVFEPAMNAEGLMAGDRSGSAKFSLFVKGKKAHVGRAFNEGRNAIVALSQLIIELNALNQPTQGITLNIGLVEGGSSVNVVPDNAVCHLDIRIASILQREAVMTSIQQLIDKYNQYDGISVTLHGGFFRLPKKITGKMLDLYQYLQQVGKELHQDIHYAKCGGCSDGNNLAAAGLPNIDTLGVLGGGIHSENEYIILDSLVTRSQLTALFLMKLAAGEIGI